MLETNSLSKSFWAEALETAVYITNRVISSSLSPSNTAHHRWHSSTPDLSNARVLGCKCFYVMPKTKVKNLDPRSREEMFVGYLPQSKGCKLWDIELRKCISSRDVTFRETMNEHPSDSKSTDGASSVDDESLQMEDVAYDVLYRGGEKTVRFSDVSVVTENPSDHSSKNAGDDVRLDEPQDLPQIPPEPERRRSARKRFQSGEWCKATAALSARVVPLSYRSATSEENI